MVIDILTLFPSMFDGLIQNSIVKRAIDKNKVSINIHNIRDYSVYNNNQVDDTPYGGGAGMVLMCDPIFRAIDTLKKDNSYVIMLTPQGETYTQKKAYVLSKMEHIILICGHYEGFDERILSIVDLELSVGDYVLTGGEIPAMIVVDSVTRLVDGVINRESYKNDSFNNNLLDYPTYTKPREYKGMKVPDVLLSGDHAKIDKWRYDKQVKITKEKRPDLLKHKIILKKEGIRKTGKKISLDDVKNIKVTEIKEKKKDCYKLIKEERLVAITVLNPLKITGYKLKGKSKDGGLTKIMIVKPEFSCKIAIKNIKKKVDILNYRLNMALNDPSNDATSKVLSEAEMLKSMIISVYSSYLGKEKLDSVIKDINRIINEFVKSKSLHNTFPINPNKNN